MRTFCNNEKALTEKLSGDNLDLFNALINAHDEITATSDIENFKHGFRLMCDMILRPDVYAQAEEQLKVLLADIINEVKNGMDMNVARKADYEKIYLSVNPSFNYDEQFSLDTCYHDIPTVDMAVFTVARRLLIEAYIVYLQKEQ